MQEGRGHWTQRWHILNSKLLQQGWQRFSEEDMEEESDGEGALVPPLGFFGVELALCLLNPTFQVYGLHKPSKRHKDRLLACSVVDNNLCQNNLGHFWTYFWLFLDRCDIFFYSFCLGASLPLQVWRADADKVTFVSKEGVDVKTEVFNNYGDKRLSQHLDIWHVKIV